MNLFSLLIVIVIIYVIIVIGLGIVLTWYYRRAYSLRYNLDQVLNQMIYIHASYLYDLRQKGYDTNRINTWFEAKKSWIMQTNHTSMDTISIYQSLKQVGEQIMQSTHTRIFEPKMIQDTDITSTQLVNYYQRYQNIKYILTYMTLGLYKIVDIYQL